MARFQALLPAPGARSQTGLKGRAHPGSLSRSDGRLRPDHAAVLHLQRSAGNAAVAGLMSGDDPYGLARVLGQGGQPLDGRIQEEMGAALGAEFSEVRVHVGDEAHASAESLGANAFTVGSDIVFAANQYDPTGEAGRLRLAHELTHVLQQRSGPVDGTETGAGVSVSDPADPFEQAAEATAEQVVAAGSSPSALGGEAGQVSPTPAHGGAHVAQGDWADRPVQRQGDEDETEGGVSDPNAPTSFPGDVDQGGGAATSTPDASGSGTDATSAVAAGAAGAAGPGAPGVPGPEGVPPTLPEGTGPLPEPPEPIPSTQPEFVGEGVSEADQWAGRMGSQMDKIDQETEFNTADTVRAPEATGEGAESASSASSEAAGEAADVSSEAVPETLRSAGVDAAQGAGGTGAEAGGATQAGGAATEGGGILESIGNFIGAVGGGLVDTLGVVPKSLMEQWSGGPQA